MEKRGDTFCAETLYLTTSKPLLFVCQQSRYRVYRPTFASSTTPLLPVSHLLPLAESQP